MPFIDCFAIFGYPSASYIHNQEENMNINYAVILIKPDAIRDSLDEVILKDILNSASVAPIFRKLWKVPPAIVAHIYPEWISRPEFPAMVFNITQGHSLFIIVKGSETIYSELIRIKGKMNKGGLRLKYRTHSIEEWQALGYFGEDLHRKIAENRLHTTDTRRETTFLCSLSMDPHEIKTLEMKHPVLANEIRRHTALQVWTR